MSIQLAVQMYLQNPRGKGDKPISKKDLAEAKKIITNNNMKYATHAPLSINLCSLTNDYVVDIVVSDMLKTTLCGGIGVVVHTGQKKEMSHKDATKRQKKTITKIIRKILTLTDKPCKLLLETPCGEGTEICANLKEFREFFYSFDDDIKQYLGICIDTCHVYVSGVHPLDYIMEWLQTAQEIKIELVHYNDSKKSIGSHLDRHELAGDGCIGLPEMEEIAKLCTNYNIPMVLE